MNLGRELVMFDRFSGRSEGAGGCPNHGQFGTAIFL